MSRWQRSVSGLFFALGLCVAAPAQAGVWQVQVDTTALAGTSAVLAFDLVDGGLAANSVLLSGFVSTGGALLSEASSGDVTGSLAVLGAVTLGDAGFFNEHLATVTLGTSLRFAFNASSLPAEAGAFPDSFSFFMLNPVTGLPAFATSDASGALFTLELSGAPAGPVTVFTALGNEVQVSVTAVPEPMSAGLLLLGLCALGLLGSLRVRRSLAPRRG